MEKSQIPKIRLHQSKPYPKPSLSLEPKSSRPAVWDCGNTLYYSFERTSFQRHLDSTNSARSLSMLHRTDLRVFTSPATTTSSNAIKLGSLGFGTTFLQWVASVAAIIHVG